MLIVYALGKSPHFRIIREQQIPNTSFIYRIEFLDIRLYSRMKNFYLIFIFLNILAVGSPSTSPQKTKCVNILYSRVSDWLSKAQYENVSFTSI